MERTFSILFQLAISHPDAIPANSAFYLRPSSDCQRLLQQHGLLVKNVEDGLIVISESIHPPGEILRPVRSTVGFRFLMYLNRPEILDATVGWDSQMPTYVGRSRMLYLNNLDDTETIDGKPMVERTMNLALNGNNISQEDLASVSGQVHQFEVEAGVKKIRLAPLRPGGGDTVKREIQSGNTVANIAAAPTADFPNFSPLPKGAWNLKQDPTGTLNETLIADDTIVTQRAFGLIEIFKDASIDYETPIKYLIRFETVS